jgi:hypothetical protein
MIFAWPRHYKFKLMLEMSATHINKAIGEHILHPISVISDIGLSLKLKLTVSDCREWSPTLYWASE